MNDSGKQKFTWGVATSSTQIEGATGANGRGPSIWDQFSKIPGKTRGASCDFAGDHYHRWKEDITLMKDLGVDAYRFSLSWPRLFPEGDGRFNEAGAAFYERLIDGLLEAGIEPWVTLYHWDLPLSLQDRYGGWLSRDTVAAFTRYADKCFELYGNRIKNWITLNEPWCSSVLGHATGTHAPGRTHPDEAWIAGHHLLLAHAQTVERFRENWQPACGGQIGIVNNCDFRRPLAGTDEDREASQLALELMFAWFGDPVWKGDYPDSVKEAAGDALPKFSVEEKKLLKGSSDFLGLNHYATYNAKATTKAKTKAVEAGNAGIFGTGDVSLSAPEGASLTAMNWTIDPGGFGEMLHWLDRRYDHPVIIVTENGIATREPDIPAALADHSRSAFFQNYIQAALQARKEGVDLRGYFAWCLLDTFEWAWGFEVQFGLVRSDMVTGERTPKGSFDTYRDLVATHRNNIHPTSK